MEFEAKGVGRLCWSCWNLRRRVLINTWGPRVLELVLINTTLGDEWGELREVGVRGEGGRMVVQQP